MRRSSLQVVRTWMLSTRLTLRWRRPALRQMLNAESSTPVSERLAPFGWVPGRRTSWDRSRVSFQ